MGSLRSMKIFNMFSNMFQKKKKDGFSRNDVQKKKILLKSLARRILPENFNENRKQGFSIPISDWLKSGPFRDLFWDTLTSSNCQLDQTIIRELLKGQDKGRNNGERLFALLLFELWCKEYRVSL